MLKDNKKSAESPLNNMLWYGMLAFWMSIVFAGFFTSAQLETIPYSLFMSYIVENKIDDLVVRQEDIVGNVKDSKAKYKKFKTIRVDDPQLSSRLA